MNVHRGVVLTLSVGALVALIPANHMAAQRTADACAHDAVCRFVDQNIGIKAPATLAGLRTFAKLHDETSAAVKNAHVAAQMDTVHELHFPGLMIQAYVPQGGAPLLQQILVASARYRLPLGLKFGTSTIEDVQRALGAPKEVEHLPNGSARWRYENVEGTATIVFEFAPEPAMKIRLVEWLFELD